MRRPEDELDRGAVEHSPGDPVAASVDARFDQLDKQIETGFEAMRCDVRKVRDVVVAYLAQVSAQLSEREEHYRSLERRVTVLETRQKT